MTKQELQEWFYEKLFNCYWVKHKTNPDVKFLIYDKQFIRDCRISGVLGNDIVFPTEHIGDVLFEQDLKTKYIWCNYRLIWSFFESNYKDDYQEIQDLIKEFLGEIDNCKQYTPTPCGYDQEGVNSLGEIDNCKQYTPNLTGSSCRFVLGEIDNCKQYTPDKILPPLRRALDDNTIIKNAHLLLHVPKRKFILCL